MSADPDSGMSAGADSPETKVGDAGSNPASAPDKQRLQAELAGERDRYLRLAADDDNFRKRTARETERSAAAQKEAFIRDLLPAIDNLDARLPARARPHPNNSGKASG
jgi:molecular chaperone GrpE